MKPIEYLESLVEQMRVQRFSTTGVIAFDFDQSPYHALQALAHGRDENEVIYLFMKYQKERADSLMEEKIKLLQERPLPDPIEVNGVKYIFSPNQTESQEGR